MCRRPRGHCSQFSAHKGTGHSLGPRSQRTWVTGPQDCPRLVGSRSPSRPSDSQGTAGQGLPPDRARVTRREATSLPLTPRASAKARSRPRPQPGRAHVPGLARGARHFRRGAPRDCSSPAKGAAKRGGRAARRGPQAPRGVPGALGADGHAAPHAAARVPGRRAHAPGGAGPRSALDPAAATAQARMRLSPACRHWPSARYVIKSAPRPGGFWVSVYPRPLRRRLPFAPCRRRGRTREASPPLPSEWARWARTAVGGRGCGAGGGRGPRGPVGREPRDQAAHGLLGRRGGARRPPG